MSKPFGTKHPRDGILNERQHAVIDCMRMKFTDKQSMAYLKSLGFDGNQMTLYRDKKRVNAVKMERLVHIAQFEFQHQHIDRIDNTELALKLMWQNYHIERDPWKKFQMLKDIITVQPYLSSYYDASKLIIENRPDIIDNLKNLQSEENGEDYKLSLPAKTLPDRARSEGSARSGETDLNRKF